MRKLTVEYTRVGKRVNIRVFVDSVAFSDDACSFQNFAYAQGMMTDEFHHATQDRYKNPSPPINPFMKKLRKELHG